MAGKDNCIEVRDVSKKFARSLKRSFMYGAFDIGRLVAGRPGTDALRASEFWAVRDVSLELPRGGSIGIVGLNGSGKTTLLRMISGILLPTVGNIRVDGRIAPMLALGAGFKPVLSGRENIFLNLALLGVGERAAHARFDSIVDFAELSESIDAPVGTYSSGMLARLGFACAVHTDPQILVVDEVLSVGDARFRAKCRNRINELRRNGTSMLLVSHSAIMIEALSDQCLFLRKGQVAAQGGTAEVLQAYEEATIAHANTRNAAGALAIAERPADPGRLLDITSVEVRSDDAAGDGCWLFGRPGELVVALRSARELDGISVNLLVFDLTHQPGEIVQFLMSGRDMGRLVVDGGLSEVRLSLPNVGLRPGTYRIKLSVSRGAMDDLLDIVDDVRLVVREAGRHPNCAYYQARDWDCTGARFDGRPDTIDDVDTQLDL